MEIENDDGPRGSDGEREAKKRNQDDQADEVMDRTSDDARGTKRKPGDEGEREDAKRQDNMIVRSLREEGSRRDTHEALRTRGRYYIGNVEESKDKNANIAMDVQMKRTTSKSWQKHGMTSTDKNLTQKR